MYNDSKNCPPWHRRKTPEYNCRISSGNLKDVFASCSDFESREIVYGLDRPLSLTVCWLDGIISGSDVSGDIIRPLTQIQRTNSNTSIADIAERIEKGMVFSYSVKRCTTADAVIANITHGHCAIVFDELELALTFEVRSDKTRAISEPTLEKSIKGAKDSFVETLRVNTALVRRRICSPKLKTLETTVGRKSNTRIAVMYVDGVAAPALLKELSSRLEAIDVDELLSSGTLEEYIVDNPRSPFPQLAHTERPDRFAMYLLDGHVGILIDGLPFALVLPVTFADFMQVLSDKNMHFLVATALTLLRYGALLISLYLPALYVAVAMYHQEMLPTKLLLSIIEAKQNVPFSTALEVLAMLAAFGLLQEAGLRLPNPIGDTVSIIGALIVGQSAVEAQVVSPIAIIVVAAAGISCYTLPSQDMGAAVRLARLALLLSAIAAGLFGVGVVSCLLLIHLAGIESFGVNYTLPLSDSRMGGLLRLLVRVPKDTNKYRSPHLNTPDKRRQK